MWQCFFLLKASFGLKYFSISNILFQLERPAIASRTVSYACLPPDVSQTFAGTEMVISGWGYVVDKGAQYPDLKAAFVTGYFISFIELKSCKTGELKLLSLN